MTNVSNNKERLAVDLNRGAPAKDGPKIAVVFVCAFVAVLLAPFVCMPFASSDPSSEKRELAPVPQLMVDGALNTNVLADAGNYFSDHFAFRSLLVDADATIKQRLFMTSATQNVVVGNNGWLYYAGTLNDYQRKNDMTEHALANAATNIAIMQEYFSAQGKQFVLAIAPNKNELYAQNMPYYELKGEGASNAERLKPLLDARGVRYVNLHEAFRNAGETLYFERDSHWNDKGALLAYGAIMGGLGQEGKDFAHGTWVTDDHVGDVEGMLHPEYPSVEKQTRPEGADAYQITNDATNVEDNYLITKASEPDAQGSLIMYRDSFGNNLIPYFASTFGQAVFTKLVPYDMGVRMTGFATNVIVERTERHLAFFASDPPYLPSPERELADPDEWREGKSTVFTSENGPYLVVEGTLDDTVVAEGEPVYVRVDADEATYCCEAFRVSEPDPTTADFEGDSSATSGHIVGDWGYRAFIPLDEVQGAGDLHVQVLVGDENAPSVVCEA